MLSLPFSTRVFLALGVTDMRKSFDTLALATREVIGEDPLSGHLFVFCNRGRNRIKLLYCVMARGIKATCSPAKLVHCAAVLS